MPVAAAWARVRGERVAVRVEVAGTVEGGDLAGVEVHAEPDAENPHTGSDLAHAATPLSENTAAADVGAPPITQSDDAAPALPLHGVVLVRDRSRAVTVIDARLARVWAASVASVAQRARA